MRLSPQPPPHLTGPGAAAGTRPEDVVETSVAWVCEEERGRCVSPVNQGGVGQALPAGLVLL
jgi:hypothetical protein